MRGITRGLSPSPTLEAASPTPDEAAAAIAAVEQFLRDTLPPAAPAAPPAREAWLVAALHEGVEREPDLRPW